MLAYFLIIIIIIYLIYITSFYNRSSLIKLSNILGKKKLACHVYQIYRPREIPRDTIALYHYAPEFMKTLKVDDFRAGQFPCRNARAISRVNLAFITHALIILIISLTHTERTLLFAFDYIESLSTNFY